MSLQVQATKVLSLEPTSATNGQTVGTTWDTLGYNYFSVFVNLGRTNTVSNVPSVCKLQEADVTNTSSFADISGATFTNGYTNGNTNGADMLAAHLSDTGNRKRYIRLQVTPATTQVVSAVCVLSRPEQAPTTASAMGLAAGGLLIL